LRGGRHAIELAGRGYRLTGVDQSEEFKAEARLAVPDRIRWVCGDMRELPWTGEFGGAYCFGNSFGYLGAGGVRSFLAAVAGVLKPGGRFVVDTGMAAESILPGLLKTRWHRIGGMYMLSENEYHPAEGRLDIAYTFIREGMIETRPSSSYVFTAAELCRMHSEAGLQPVELLGSLGGQPFTLGSPRLLLAAEKG
jgi:SAM-dependent methyltransferase